MKIMYRLILSVILVFSIFILSAQNRAYQEYIDKHQHIAISEMHRTGVPASIKLAQALIESNAGRSELAQKANNHFGIKCGGDWTGKSFHKEDDDYNSNGELMKSCFRHFGDVEESFVAHSEFLRNPAKTNRYGFLFNLETTDYKGWAHGLKKAGYATNPSYANILIRVVEEYKLHLYDQQVSPSDKPLLAASQKEISKQAAGYKFPQKVVINNMVPMVFARRGDTPASVSKRTGTDVQKIVASNEDINTTSQELQYGQRVYLTTKRSTFRGSVSWHYVQKGENMQSIAQQYGLQLKSLLKKNRLQQGEEPSIGERLSLKRKIRRADKPKLKTEQPSILPDKPEIKGPDPDHVLDSDGLQVRSDDSYHIVEPGETLYAISRKHGLSVSRIKELNQLEADTIRVGQALKIR
jgi:LysM repeat protein